MKVSKKQVEQIGRILAEACHACNNREQRAGVLTARDHILDAVAGGQSFERYTQGADAFANRLWELEPLFPSTQNWRNACESRRLIEEGEQQS